MPLFDTIPPVEVDGSIPLNAKCQEASVFSRSSYIPCMAPARVVVYHERDRRAYYMCLQCADHNVRNRGGKWCASLDRHMKERYPEQHIDWRPEMVDHQQGDTK